MHIPILTPLLALVLWSFVMLAWLYATRIPAIVKGRIVYDPSVLRKNFTRNCPRRCDGRRTTTTT
jgi:hypothetical protein